MEEWKEYMLGDVCDLIPGFAFKSADFGNYSTKAIKIKDIQPPFVDTDGADGVNIAKYDINKLSKFVVRKGDFILAMTGATIGKIGRYIDEIPAYLNQRVLRFAPKEIVDFDFVYYYLSTKHFQTYIINHIDSESAQPNISGNTISKYPIHLPNRIIQERISAILKSLDDKIEVNRRINDNLEQQAQALFKSWFVDFEPFKNGEFVESELGMIPKGWRVGKLGDIAEINPIRKISKGQVATYLDMKNMPTSGSFPLNWEEKEFSGGMKFRNGDTLMARITPCLENGKVAYVNFLQDDEIGFGSTEYIVMTAKNSIFPELLYTLCRFPLFVGYATKHMNGSSGRQRVSGDSISNYTMVIASDAVYNQLRPIFENYMRQIREIGFENLHLATLLDTLLPRLMSGELKVNDIKTTN